MNKVQRTFFTGDKWIYYKLYTGPRMADFILTDRIKPVVKGLLKNKIINKWFFIRFGDPKHHLRVRFHCKNSEDIAQIIRSLFSELQSPLEKDIIWKMQLDTYHRELERYGTRTMELSETLFYYDSEMIVNFIDLIEGDEGEELRWLFSLRAIDNLLNSFKYTEAEKLQLLEVLKTGFSREFNMSRPLKKQLDDRYRTEREKIAEFMIFTAAENPDFAPILKVLQDYDKKVFPLAKKIRDVANIDLNNLLGSYIHMLMNRLFKSQNRLHELVCYDFLYRYYRSNLARKNASPKTKDTLQ